MNQALPQAFQSRFRAQVFYYLAFVIFVFAQPCARAALFTVTRTNATGPGSLAAIITQANSTPGDNTIEFGVGGTFTLNVALPPVTNNLTITGRAEDDIVISGGGVASLLQFGPGTTNRLIRLTLMNGFATGDGGAILNQGTLRIEDCEVVNNQAVGAGGGIYNSGDLSVSRTLLSSNFAAEGGAVYNQKNLTISASSLRENLAGAGGSIYNAGTLTADRLTVASNRADQGLGGGLYNASDSTITSSTFVSNEALGETGARGGNAINNGGVGAGGGGGGGGGAGFGGGLYSNAGNVFLTNCTFSGNIAAGGHGGEGGSRSMLLGDGNGGTGGRGGKGGNMPGGAGGFGARLSTNATWGTGGGFAGGGGGGGGGNGSSTQEIRYGGQGASGGWGAGQGGAGGHGANLTGGPWFRSAEDGAGGNGGSGYGGGLFVHDGIVRLVNCTVAFNSTQGGNSGSGSRLGAPGSGIAGGIYRYGGTLSLLNTVVAENSAASSSPDLGGQITSTGFNLVSNSQGATGLSVNDYQDEPANLGLLRDNGGITLTHALLAGSLAVGGGNASGAPSIDQRGVSRPMNQIDIGAYQSTPGVAENPPRLVINSLGHSVELTVLGVPGALYRLEYSADLKSGVWSKLTDLLLPTTPFAYTDTAPIESARYYRLVFP